MPREHALGDDLDAGARRDQALQPHAKADRLADLFAKRRGHARRGGAGGETARLEQDDALALAQGSSSSASGDARRLAGARRRDEHGGVCARARRAEGGSASSIGRGAAEAAHPRLATFRARRRSLLPWQKAAAEGRRMSGLARARRRCEPLIRPSFLVRLSRKGEGTRATPRLARRLQRRRGRAARPGPSSRTTAARWM